MDRDGDAGTERPGDLGRRPRREMPRTHVRSPAADRQQGDVDAIGEGPHPRKRRGVAGEVDPGLGRALDQVADGGRSRGARPSPVTRGHGRDRPAGGDRHRLADEDLAGPQADPADDPAEAARDDHERIAGERRQRPPVEVVRVGVGDRDEPDRADRAGLRGGAVAPERPQAVAEERVRQDPEAGQVQQDGGVTQVRDADRGPGRFARRSRGELGELGGRCQRRQGKDRLQDPGSPRCAEAERQSECVS